MPVLNFQNYFRVIPELINLIQSFIIIREEKKLQWEFYDRELIVHPKKASEYRMSESALSAHTAQPQT